MPRVLLQLSTSCWRQTASSAHPKRWESGGKGVTFIGGKGHGVCFRSLDGGSMMQLGEDGVSSEGGLEADESTVWTNKAAEVVLGTKLVLTGP